MRQMDMSHHTKSKGDLGVLKAQKMFVSNVSLRVEASKNCQTKRVNFASDFRRAP